MRKVIAEPSFPGSTDIGAIELGREVAGRHPGASGRASSGLLGRGDAGGAVPPSGGARSSGPPPGHGPPGDGPVADSGDGDSEAGSPVRLRPSPGDREPACGRPGVPGPRRPVRPLPLRAPDDPGQRVSADSGASRQGERFRSSRRGTGSREKSLAQRWPVAAARSWWRRTSTIRPT